MGQRQPQDNHAALHAGFAWDVPTHFNIAQACCGRWAQAPGGDTRVAVRAHGLPAGQDTLTYAQLQRRVNRLANLLAVLGVRRGDRVAIVLPQRFEAAVAYVATLQMGAVAMPLPIQFGPQALEYRLRDSDAVVAICDESSVNSLVQVRPACPALRTLIGVGAAALRADLDYEVGLSTHSPQFEPAPTLADDPALLSYTSGTTGAPQGALIPHRALVGNLPGFVCSQNWFGFDPARPGSGTDAVFWSPADWAWTGGLMDALLPTLYFGRPIVACNGRFSPELAFALMQSQGVTHTFLPPAALKAMIKAFPTPRAQWRLKLQAIMSAGEAVDDAVFDYCQVELGVTVNEMFGQTEARCIVGNCAMNGEPSIVGWPARAGSMGRPYPGHRVAVIDDQGRECPPGVAGDVALHRLDVQGRPDPIFFLGYWRRDDATAAKFTGHWYRTGDLAVRDADGYLWYQGRSDDVERARQQEKATA